MSVIAKYKFNNTLADLLPEFNSEFTPDLYTVTDEVSEGVTTRTIESDSLPTMMRFGRVWVEEESATDNRADSLLEVLDMNTSGLTSCRNMFRYNKNLTSINCEWNTGNVTDMGRMFDVCTNLTTLDVSNWNTSNVTNMKDMFWNCTNLTTLDVSNWNTSSVTDMSNMFFNCNNLASLDVSNWVTSSLKDSSHMFQGCQSLTLLDVSNWNTSNVASIRSMFYDCRSLTSLDVSNWNTNKVNDTIDTFKNTPELLDIGMLYCSQDTINKVITPIDNGSKTIWVKDTKASDYTDLPSNVTVKDYTGDNREFYLTSPLLEGDKIVEKDGKMYHYHKMRSVVLDGSHEWDSIGSAAGGVVNTIFVQWYPDYKGVSNNIVAVKSSSLKAYSADDLWNSDKEGISRNVGGAIQLRLSRDKLKEQNGIAVAQWFSENPTTVVYRLAEPYYEELVTDGSPTLQSLANSDFSLVSDVPAKMISSKPFTMDAMYLYPSTTYTVQFVSTNATTADVYVGGATTFGQSIKPGVNHVQVTTPSTLVDNEVRISATNTEIYQIVVTDVLGNVDYFHGMKSSFEDAYIPVSLLNTEALWLNDNQPYNYTYDVIEGGLNGKTFTVINDNDFEVLLYTNSDGILGPTGTQQASITIHPNSIQKFTFTNNQELRFLVTLNLDCAGQLTNVLILEGDYTNQPLPSVEDVKEYGGTYTMDITVCTSPYNFGKKGRI